MDPHGRHLLICHESGDNYYLFHKWKKPKLLVKLKGMVLESIAWTRPGRDFTTGSMLLGTRSGQIYEAELQAADDLFKRGEKYLRLVRSFYLLFHEILNEILTRYHMQVHELPFPEPICAIHAIPFPTNFKRFVILVATPNRLYQYIGDTLDPERDGASFHSLFQVNDNPQFQEIPGELDYTDLCISSPFVDEDGWMSTPTSFAWLTGKFPLLQPRPMDQPHLINYPLKIAHGVYHGLFSFGSQCVGDSVLVNAQLLPWPMAHIQTEESPSNPIQFVEIPNSIELTDWHFILAYEGRVKAVNKLRGDVVWDNMMQLVRN